MDDVDMKTTPPPPVEADEHESDVATDKRAPSPSSPPEGIPVSVPFFIDEKTEDCDRVGIMRRMVAKNPMCLPAFIVHTLPGVSRKHHRSAFTVAALADVWQLASRSPIRPDRSDLDKLRAHIQEGCHHTLVPHITAALRDAERRGVLPPLSELNRDAITFRCSAQLADCAVFDIRPPDLVGYRQKHAAKENQTRYQELEEAFARMRQSARYANQREHDAKQLLKVRSGAAKGPLSPDNLACADIIDQMYGGGSSSSSSSASPYENQMQTVIALLIETLLNADRVEESPIQNQVNVVNQIMKQARILSVTNGVLVFVEPKSGAGKRALVVQWTEAQSLMLGSAPSEAHRTRTDELLQVWIDAHQYEKANPHSLRRRTIINHEGKGDQVIQENLSPLDVGYECSNRAGYYRGPRDGAYTWEERDLNYKMHTAGVACLPDRACLPLKKSIQYFYLCHNGVRFAVKSCFRPIPNILFPTCPMINLLLAGSMPYHMGSHAMLDQYTMLMWTAINRACPPGMGPITGDDPQAHDLSSSGVPREAHTQRRDDWCVGMLGTARNDDHSALPPWCGKWFVPPAYMPRPESPQDMEVLYPRADTQYRRLVGEAWVRTGEDATVEAAILEGVDAAIRENEKARRRRENEDVGIDARPKSKTEQYEEKMRESAKDTTLAGRAEYVMTLALMSIYFDMINGWEAQYNGRVRALRSRFPDRPREYYDELWNVCVESTASLLEIHEVIILMLNSRWVDVDAAVGRMSEQHRRMHPSMVRNTNTISAQIVRTHRQRNFDRRLTMVDHLPAFRDRVLRAVPWAHESPRASGERPDLPTYVELMVFEEFHASIPIGDPARPGAEAEDDPMTADLIARTEKMSMRIGREQREDTQYVMQRYELPLAKVRETGWRDPRGQKHEHGAVPEKPMTMAAGAASATKRARN